MQVEISLLKDGDDYDASDLGFLLHKNPTRLHQRETSAGQATVFFSEISPSRATAVLHLELDPIALVRGKSAQATGPLAQYVNDRPFVANSFLSVALARSFSQSMAGKSKERQDLADRPLPLEARVVPVAAAGRHETIESLFGPLDYKIDARPIAGAEDLFDLRLAGAVRLRDLLSHLYVLVPVLDNAKHYWIDRDEIEKLIEKGEGWLPSHPAKELIAARALKHRRSLVNAALEQLTSTEEAQEDDDDAADETSAGENALEKPIRLHEVRLDAVVAALRELGATSVLDLGCGEGKLLDRLKKLRGVERALGVDPTTRALQRAAARLRLDRAGQAERERIGLQFGSLTYGDRRWRGFDAATLVEVIEHIDPPRLSSLARSLFGDARPKHVVVTTPNREYNALFDRMRAGALRHPDHRFEWTRAEFADWSSKVAEEFGYAVDHRPLGPEDAALGAPSQMAIFTREARDA